MSARVATVRLVDGSSVTVEEPAYCVAHHPDGEALEDFFHDGPETSLIVETGRGPVEILNASVAEYPYRADPERRLPVATVLLDGAFYELDPVGLRALASGLVGRADELRDLARELARLRAAAGGAG